MNNKRFLAICLAIIIPVMLAVSTSGPSLTPEERAARAAERERIEAEIQATPLTQAQIDDFEESYRICLSGFGAFITAEAVQSCREVADRMAYDYRRDNYRAGGS